MTSQSKDSAYFRAVGIIGRKKMRELDDAGLIVAHDTSKAVAYFGTLISKGWTRDAATQATAEAAGVDLATASAWTAKRG